MVQLSTPLFLALWMSMGGTFMILGYFLEQKRVTNLEIQKQLQKTAALRTMPKRSCGEWVFTDGKGHSHHCILEGDHDGDLHRSETGMGRMMSHVKADTYTYMQYQTNAFA